MPTIYVRHPLHGVKPCNSVQEADADKANGWEEFDPFGAPATPVEVTPPVTPQVSMDAITAALKNIKS